MKQEADKFRTTVCRLDRLVLSPKAAGVQWQEGANTEKPEKRCVCVLATHGHVRGLGVAVPAGGGIAWQGPGNICPTSPEAEGL